MPEADRHESTELIVAFLAERLDHLQTYRFGGVPAQRHSLNLLRSLCRAADHGRMPKDMHRRYEGLLKRFRPQIMALHRSGQFIRAAVLSEVRRIYSGSRSKPSA